MGSCARNIYQIINLMTLARSSAQGEGEAAQITEELPEVEKNLRIMAMIRNC